MRTLVHLSDLHFGRVDQALLGPLRELVHSIAADVVVISGDLTQRAKAEEFEEARAFLDSLPGPQIVVPGNHDISLYNVLRRFARPLSRYRRYITDNLEPVFIDAVWQATQRIVSNNLAPAATWAVSTTCSGSGATPFGKPLARLRWAGTASSDR